MAQKMYVATASIRVKLVRACRCGHTWILDENVKGESQSSMSRSGLQEKAQASAEEKAAMVAKCKEVLCPKCDRFTDEAVRCHFKSGWKLGLLAKYNNELLRDIKAAGCSSVIIACIAGGLGYGWMNGVFLWSFWVTVLVGVALAFVILVIMRLDAMVLYSIYNHRQARIRLIGLPDAVVLEEIIATYRKNGNSLSDESVASVWSEAMRRLLVRTKAL